MNRFRDDIIQYAPAVSKIKSIRIKKIPVNAFKNFDISKSIHSFNIETEISPDIAVCQNCLSDLKNQSHRLNYPFINCTNCGPRFTIIKEMPYDRDKTTMSEFNMCQTCESEFHDSKDRRFHAQPIACNHCGPTYVLENDEEGITDLEQILYRIAELLENGKIIALKGQGGYHLICDALNNESILILRSRKQRDNKPFAVMFRNLKTVKEYCYLSEKEEQEICSWRRPILILKQKKPLASAVNSGLKTIGAILPYMPFHFLLFEKLSLDVIVLTSGNISDEPIIIDDLSAKKKLGNIVDAVISYNRQIFNRADDSVMQIINNKISIIRRSRGFTPNPVNLRNNVSGILAVGAEQKNTFCIGINQQAILSQYIGDLKNIESYSFFKEAVERFSNMFRFTPDLIACDLHPDYFSTKFARELSQTSDIPLHFVQHHHAHIVSCMAEQKLDEKVIGVCFDGTGYGTDGKIWGGEFLIADTLNFTRYKHFDYVPMPGGDICIEEPWRIALSYLYLYFGNKLNFKSLYPFLELSESKIDIILKMLSGNINSHLTSGAGRLFDAVASLTGLCLRSTFEAEAPMRFESSVISGTNKYYPYTINEKSVSFEKTFDSILKDLSTKDHSMIATKFHNTIANIIKDIALLIRNEEGINKVVLSGGVFHNRYLCEKTINILTGLKFNVFYNNLVPPNDGGISLGQLLIASKSRMICA